jgi:hypothetical protein
MKKVEYLLQHKTENLTVDELYSLRSEYIELLTKNKFPTPPVDGDPIRMIHYLKRKEEENSLNIGPYRHITPFEAANRIASDLVIIAGLIQLVNEGKEPANSIITIRLGTKHQQDKGDFIINGKEGEAFNVAPTFFSGKMYQTKAKWKKIIDKDNLINLSYILVNAEVLNGEKSIKMNNTEIIGVNNWDKL